MTIAAASKHKPSGRAVRLSLLAVRSGPLIILAVLVIVMASLSPYFLTTTNIINVGVQAAPIAVLALGQFFIILTKGIDLSVGAVAALSSVIGIYCFTYFGFGSWMTVLTIIAVGVLVGWFNGFVFVRFKIPHSFIVTLGTLNVATGFAYLISGGSAIPGTPPLITDMLTARPLGIPVPIIVVVVCAVAAVILLNRTQIGRWIYAIGGNTDAARRAGIPVDRVLIFCYVLSGLAAGVAGLLYTARSGGGDPQAGGLAELQSIAAVIIGGVSFFGGRGHILTVLVGAAILAVISNGLNLLSVNAFWQLVATGAVLIVAVIADVGRARLEDRLRLAAGDAS